MGMGVAGRDELNPSDEGMWQSDRGGVGLDPDGAVMDVTGRV